MKMLKWVGGFLVLIVLLSASAGAVSKYLITSPSQIKPGTITAVDLNPSALPVQPLTYSYKNVVFPVYGYGCGGQVWANVTANVTYVISLNPTGIYEVQTIESGTWQRIKGGGVPNGNCGVQATAQRGTFTGVESQYLNPFSFNQGATCVGNCTYSAFLAAMFIEPNPVNESWQFVYSDPNNTYTDIDGILTGGI